MKIILTTKKQNAASYIFYSQSLLKINHQNVGAHIQTNNDPENVDYQDYEIILFMGYDQYIERAKQINPNARIGIIDPRASQSIDWKKVDFIITNGIESTDYFSSYCENIVEYFVYPSATHNNRKNDKDKLLIGYHGNRIHLSGMIPRISNALKKLNEEHPLELWAMYRFGKKGILNKIDRQGFKVRHINYSPEGYDTYMSMMDVGIVPQMIPVKKSRFLRKIIGTQRSSYNERPDNYIMRFKETTNIGRALVFAQYSIPVVSDMSPSACSFFGNHEHGFIAHNTDGWHRMLKKLAESKELRTEMGLRIKKRFDTIATHEKMNEFLIAYLRRIISTPK